MNANNKSIKSDLARIDAMSNEEIDYSDCPELTDDFFNNPTVNPFKTQLTIECDEDIFRWLKSQGDSYQVNINHILRMAMENHLI